MTGHVSLRNGACFTVEVAEDFDRPDLSNLERPFVEIAPDHWIKTEELIELVYTPNIEEHLASVLEESSS